MMNELKETIFAYNDLQESDHLNIDWSKIENINPSEEGIIKTLEYLRDFIKIQNFYNECLSFHAGNKKKALNDVLNLRYDPTTPNGKLLNSYSKVCFLKLNS